MDKETLRFDFFQLIRPCTGETLSGDITLVKSVSIGLLAAIVDVSGHGSEAHELALTLKNEIMSWPDVRLTELMIQLNNIARASRGAAVGLAMLHSGRSSLSYVGVGNTSIQKHGRCPWKGISRDGVLGSRMPTLKEETVDLQEGDVVVLHTDGLREHIRPQDYPRLTLETPPAIANNLIKLFGRSYDDVSCIVIKCRA